MQVESNVRAGRSRSIARASWPVALGLAMAALPGLASRAVAGDIVYSLTPADVNFSGINWAPGQDPTATPTQAAGLTDFLYFGGAPTIASTPIGPLNNDLTDAAFTGISFNGNATAFTINGNAFTLDGDLTNSSTSLQAINAAITLGAVRTINTATSTGNVALSGVISGAGGITKAGSGSLTLSGNNTYTGGTTVNAGALLLVGTNNAGSGAITVNSGAVLSLGSKAAALDGNNALTAANTVTLNDATLTFSQNSTTLTYAAFPINMNGNSSLLFAGTDVQVDTINSPIVLNNTGGTQTATISESNAKDTLNFQGVISGTGDLTIKPGGNGNPFTVTLNKAATYSGNTFITRQLGTFDNPLVKLLAGGSLPSTTVLTLSNGGTTGGTAKFDLGGQNQTLAGLATSGTLFANDNVINSANATASALTLNVSAATTYTFEGSIGSSTASTSNISLTKNGPGTQVLTGSNYYTGGTTISAGTLQIAGTAGTLGTGAVTNNGILQFNRTNTTAINTANAISGSGSVEQNGSGVSTFQGANSYAGGTTINAGAAYVAGSTNSAFGTGPIVVAAGALTGFSTNASVSISNAISGAGGVNVITTADTLVYTLSGANSYTGPTTVNRGTLRINAINGLGSTSELRLGSTGFSGTLQFNGTASQTLTAPLSLAGSGGTLSVINTGNLTLNGGLSYADTGVKTLTLTGTTATSNVFSSAIGDNSASAVSVVKAGATTPWILSASNTYTGGTTINAGTLSVTGSLADAGAVTVAGGTYDVAASDTVGAVTVSSGTISGVGTLTGASYAVNPATGITATISAPLAGAAALTKSGAGIGVLSGANTYTGGTTISGGTLGINADAALGAAPAAAATNLAFTATSGLQVSNSFTLGATRNITLIGTDTFDTQSNTLTIAGVLSGAGVVSKSGAGTLILANSNTYTGGTTISAGTLSINADAALGTAPATAATNLTFSANSTLQVSNSITLAATRNVSLTGTADTIDTGANTLTIGGALTGAGNITKINTGTLILANDNSSWTGGITQTAGANSGAIRLTNSNGLGGNTTAKTITTTADSGSGTTFAIELANNITVNNKNFSLNGRTVTAAKAALRNVSGNNTWNGNLTIVGAGGGYSVDNLAGTLTLGGTISNTVASSNRGLAFFGAGNYSLTGSVIDGSATAITALNLSGTGTVTVASGSTTTYTGGTTINSGTLRADNGTPTAGTSLGGGTVAVNASGTLAGVGRSGAGVITVNAGTGVAGGTVTAGTGATSTDTSGTLGSGNQVWKGGAVIGAGPTTAGGRYVVKFQDNTAASGGTSGSWDKLALGTLDLTNLSVTNKFNLVLVKLTGGTFNTSTSRSFVIASGTNILTSAAPSGVTANTSLTSLFALDTSGLGIANSTPFTVSSGSAAGDLVVSFQAAPEPTTAALVGLSASVVLGRRRRRHRPVGCAAN